MPVQPSPMVFIALREATVARLTPMLSGDEDTFDAVIDRCIETMLSADAQTVIPQPASFPPPQPERATSHEAVLSTWPTANAGRYIAEVLGARLGAPTLGKLFRDIVDAVHYLDPAVIERLSGMKAYTRCYVARALEDIHDGRTDLPTLRARSGWWVSANIGTEDLKRGLRALCEAGGLDYGCDVRFPA